MTGQRMGGNCGRNNGSGGSCERGLDSWFAHVGECAHSRSGEVFLREVVGMSFAERVDRFHLRYPRTGYPLAVAYKFFDDQGGYLAALVAYYGFVSLFPLLLLFTTVLEWVLRGNPHLREQIVNSAMSEIPVIGTQLGQPGQLNGGAVAVTIGIVGALYGGLGVAVASQNAMNIIWAVPRNERPDPIRVRLRGMVLLSTVGTAIVALTAVNGAISAIDLGTVGLWFSIAGSAILSTILFVIAFRIGTVRQVSTRDVLPGAVAAAIGWQALQSFGSIYVTHVIAHAGATTGVFAVVLGLLAYLNIAALLVMFCLEANAVRVDKLYPRSLLTPFTDNVVLTDGDEAAYAAQAKAQRNKGFETIEVSFDNPATADRREN